MAASEIDTLITCALIMSRNRAEEIGGKACGLRGSAGTACPGIRGCVGAAGKKVHGSGCPLSFRGALSLSRMLFEVAEGWPPPE
jgi:hypothetical protein